MHAFWTAALRPRVLLIVAVLFLPLSAAAQTYPNRPITLIHGFAAGGNADVIARIVASGLSERLGQPVVVESRTGAGGNVAADRVAKSTPDGYTLLIIAGGHAISAAIYNKLPYHPVDDFQMISTLVFFPFVVAVSKDSPHGSIADLLVTAKTKPGTVTYSSTGVGTTPHLAGELMASASGTQMVHVPYRGGGTPLNDVLAGRVDILIDSLTITAPQIEAKTIKGLAVTSLKAWPSLPGVPPVSATLPGFDVQSYHSIAAAKGTPTDVVERLNRATREALDLPSVRTRLEQIGNVVQPSTPEALRMQVSQDIVKWSKIIADAKVPRQ